MQHNNQFQYIKSTQLDQVTLLQAKMDDFSYDKHVHEEFAFGITLSGRQDFFANGAFHRSRPGNLIVFNPEAAHDGHSGEKQVLNYYMLYIHPSQLEPMLASAGVRNSQGYRIADTMLEDALLRQHLLNLAALVEKKSTSKIAQECALYQMAERIAQCYGSYLPDRKSCKIDSLLRLAKDFIQENIHQDLSLADICQQVHLSKYHFLRMFRQHFGITPHQYILNCRVNRAREQLECGVALNDVVFEYGFSDLSHFNRRFKPIFGMTPRQYQRHFLSS